MNNYFMKINGLLQKRRVGKNNEIGNWDSELRMPCFKPWSKMMYATHFGRVVDTNARRIEFYSRVEKLFRTQFHSHFSLPIT